MGLKQNNVGTFFNLKIKDQKYPEFQLMGKKDGEWVVKEFGNNYSGIFTNASVGEYTYKKDKMKKLVLEFTNEDGEKETLSMNFNSLALNIINTLSSEKELVGKIIDFSVYSKKDKDGEDRPRIYIKINGEKGEWKYDAKAISGIYDDKDRWVDMFNKHIKASINSFMPESEGDDEAVVDTAVGELPTTVVVPEDIPNDLPF